MTGIAPEDQPTHEATPTAPVVTDKPNPIPSHIPEQDPYTTGRERRERWKFGMEIAAFFILIVGLWLTWISVDSLERQTTALTEQVYAGERAYLLIRNVQLVGDGAPQLEIGDRLRLQWETVNVGRTPAQNLITEYALYYGDKAADPPAGSRSGYSEARVLGPGDKETSPDVIGVWLDRTQSRRITPDEQRRLDAGELFLNVRIVVAYDTVFPDVRGRTEICAYYEGAQFSYCGLRGMQIQ